MSRYNYKSDYAVALILSILLHILFLIAIVSFNLLSYLFAENPPQEQPLVLELEPPGLEQPLAASEPEPEPEPKQEQEQKKQPEFEQPQQKIPIPLYHENTNADGQKVEEAIILSDKFSRSAAPDITTPEEAVAPDAEQGAESQQGEMMAEEEEKPELEDLAGDASTYDPSHLPVFTKEVLAGAEQETGEQNTPTQTRGQLELVQKSFSAQEVGDFRLSTYDWNYVPWQQAFIGKLYRVWQAPSAWYMGLIHGHTVIKFRISRDGRLLGYEVLEHNGHESLQTGNVNAIESVFPFRQLPESFPDDYLEITFRMIYPNLRDYRQGSTP